jgi:hypothetical protein
MRTSFELKFETTDYNSARSTVVDHVSTFLGIGPEEVAEKTDTELKVELVNGKYEVTAYSKLKSSFIAFGLDK